MTTPAPSTRRTTPLHAASEAPSPAPSVTKSASAGDARDARFVEGVRTLRVGGASVKLEERILLVIGGVLAPLGLVVVLLGWWGASHTPYVFEQLPYVVSGGLLGLGLMFLGSFMYFTHWVTQLVKEHRVQSVAMLEALQRLQDKLTDVTRPAAPGVPTNGVARVAGDGAVVLVATERGTMAHLPDCVVVAGKTALRSVAAADGLSTCKLCGSGS